MKVADPVLTGHQSRPS